MIQDLQFASPESQGIRSEDVLEFIRLLEYQKINLHSFLIAKNGKIVAEGYVPPFNKDFKHRIYSASKSFVALAIGRLITEGKLTLKDPIAPYLADYIDTELHPWKQEITVEDCLTMSLPMSKVQPPAEDANRWCHSILNHSVAERPAGTLNHYDFGADLLAVVAGQVAGKEFLEILRPIFDAIGVADDIRCIKTAEGVSWGGSGVICTLRDFAKVGEFVLNKGMAGGKQWIDRTFMEKATTKQVSNFYKNDYHPLHTGGYGYLFWITPEGFALRGMGCQQIFCFPQKGLMFACQGDTQSGNDSQAFRVYDLVKYLLYDRIGAPKEEGEAYSLLKQKLQALQPPTYGEAHSEYAAQIDGKTYQMAEGNPLGWRSFRFDFSKDHTEGTLCYQNARGQKTISFGMGALKAGKFPETHYYGEQYPHPANREFDCQAVCEWVEEQKLLLRVYITDTCFGNLFITFGFKGDEVGIYAAKRAEYFLEDYSGITAAKLK